MLIYFHEDSTDQGPVLSFDPYFKVLHNFAAFADLGT